MRERSEFRIMCAECGKVHYHKCPTEHEGDSLRKAFLAFLTWVPEFGMNEKVQKAMQKAGEESGWLEKGQDFTKFPFFGAQPWTYAMGDKHFGREFSGEIDRILRAAGFEPHEIRDESYRMMNEAEEAKKQQEEGAAKNKKARTDTVKLFQIKSASLDEKIAALDKVIASYASSLSPIPHKDAKGYIEDSWMSDLTRHLKNRYEGGISPEVNKLRIEAARKIATTEGTFRATFYSAKSLGSAQEGTFVRRFQTREEMEEAMISSYKPYDALSEDPFANSVGVVTRERGLLFSRVQYARGKKGWIVVKDDREREAAE